MTALAQRRVLVLNRSWTVVNVISLKDAITKLYSEYTHTGEPKAKIIDPSLDFAMFSWDDWAQIEPEDDGDVIHSACGEFRIPEVILLTDYDKFPKHRVKFSRRMIYRRDNYMCQYCGKIPGTPDLTIDHIVPRAQGGQTTWLNCVVACIKCNSRKDNRTPKQAGMKLKREPYKPKFSLFKGERKVVPKSWRHFMSEAYWETELLNDEPEE